MHQLMRTTSERNSSGASKESPHRKSLFSERAGCRLVSTPSRIFVIHLRTGFFRILISPRNMGYSAHSWTCSALDLVSLWRGENSSPTTTLLHRTLLHSRGPESLCRVNGPVTLPLWSLSFYTRLLFLQKSIVVLPSGDGPTLLIPTLVFRGRQSGGRYASADSELLRKRNSNHSTSELLTS